MIRDLMPAALRQRFGAGRRWIQGIVRAVPVLVGDRPQRTIPRAWYGFDRLPQLSEHSHGGIVKFQHLERVYPNTPRGFNILYMVSSQPPGGALEIARAAKWKGARLVWNQNGVAYPGWHGPGWERTNAPMGTLLRLADHVFYQSEFCRMSADRFLGRTSAPTEILYNPVDTEHFTPARSRPPGLVLLLGGTQYQRYRLEAALRTLAFVRRRIPDARMIVTGRILLDGVREHVGSVIRLARGVGVEHAIDLTGPYTQADAPDIFRRAHVLLHPKYNDPSPGVVLEAMACGLPIVHSASGGVPELVGEDAGIGVPAALSWERDQPPDPAMLAEAVLLIADALPRYSEAARSRAVGRFDLAPWVKRHREVFEALL